MIISYIDYPYYVGLSKRISGISEVLTSNGIAVNVLAPIARSDVVLANNKSLAITVKRINLRRFGTGRTFSSKLAQWFVFSIWSAVKIIKAYSKEHPIIQYQSLFSAFSTIPARLLGATIIGDDVVLTNKSPINFLAFKFTSIISTPSTKTYTLAKKLGRPVIYVPNGIARSDCIRTKPKKPLNFIFVGALSFSQNMRAVENIIKLADNLEKDKLDFEISIVGGPLSAATHLLNNHVVLSGKVRFRGYLSFLELDKLYSSSFVGLLPFFEDIPLEGGQRTKALEFFANCLLVISGPEGVKGITGLKSGEHCIIVQSLGEVLEVIKDTLTNPEKYENIAITGARYVMDHHSWANLTTEYINKIHALTQN